MSWTHLVVLIDPIYHGCFDQLLVTRVGGIYGVKPLCTRVLDLGITPKTKMEVPSKKNLKIFG